MKKNRYIQILSLLMAVILMTACKSGDGFGPGSDDEQDCYLTIYVYTQGNPIPTRADEHYQTATAEEQAIHTVQLWVFKHTDDASDGELVGYMEDGMDGNGVDLSAGKTYQVVVRREFADSPTDVDVYAVANVAQDNAGHTFSRQTTRAQLDAATLSGNYFFGASDKLVHSVPATGLPMTGVLKEQKVVGTFPALRVVDKNDATEKMVNVNLVRTMSRLRFVICRSDGNSPYEQLNEITGITLNGNMIPRQTYLMLTEPYDDAIAPADPLAANRIRIEPGDYESTAINFGSVKAVDTDGTTVIIPVRADDPNTTYKESVRDWLYDALEEDGITRRYTTMSDYIDAINTGITNGELLQYGLTYLRESDKKLSGTVTYTTMDYPNDPVRSATFEMADEGDFARNHVWTVMLLFEGGKLRTINVVDIGVRAWETKWESDHSVYNW